MDGANIRRNHGPLGVLYPPQTWTSPNPHSAIKEGDTPSWFYFLPHGLNDPEHPEWGGWGGRFERDSGGIYRDARDHVGELTDARATVWRWRPAFQAEFQARLNWCVADSFEKANHLPIAVLNGERSRAIVHFEASAGETVQFSAVGSTDPDGDELRYRWFVYPEASTYRGKISLSSIDSPTASFIAPAVIEPQSVHAILQITDDGSPMLSAFRRADRDNSVTPIAIRTGCTTGN